MSFLISGAEEKLPQLRQLQQLMVALALEEGIKVWQAADSFEKADNLGVPFLGKHMDLLKRGEKYCYSVHCHCKVQAELGRPVSQSVTPDRHFDSLCSPCTF